jgi:hypothetical protein
MGEEMAMENRKAKKKRRGKEGRAEEMRMGESGGGGEIN